MFLTEERLHFPVRVDKPNPVVARALQQAIGGAQRGQMSSDAAQSAQMSAGQDTGLPAGPAGVL